MKNMIVLLTSILAMTTGYAQTISIPAKAAVCYGNQGVNQAVPYVLTLHEVNEFKIGLINEDFLSDAIVSSVSMFNFDGVAVYTLSVNPHVQGSGSIMSFNKKMDRKVRRAVAKILKNYEIKASGYSLDYNGVVQ